MQGEGVDMTLDPAIASAAIDAVQPGALYLPSRAQIDTLAGITRSALDEIERIQKDLDIERMRLAACGVAALGWFDGCVDEYRSATLTDTLALVENNAALRKEAAALRARLSALDCRQVGDVGEVGGSHCPEGQPCMRCRYERLLEAKEQTP